jgi:CheY-like chemotaxis protein
MGAEIHRYLGEQLRSCDGLRLKMLKGVYVYAYRFVRIVNFPEPRYFENVPRVSKRRLWIQPSFTHADRRSHRAPASRETTDFVQDRPTLVWIDDYEPGLALYRMMFEMAGYRVLTASSGKVGIELAINNSVDAVVVDYEMPEMNGYEVASALKRLRPELPIVLFSGLSLIPAKVLSVVNAYCDKAGSREELLRTIQSALRKNVKSLQPTSLPPTSEQAQRIVA